MFDEMPEKNVYSWNAVISAIVKLEVHFLKVRLSTGRSNTQMGVFSWAYIFLDPKHQHPYLALTQ